MTKDVPPGMTVVGLNKLLDPHIDAKREKVVKKRTERRYGDTLAVQHAFRMPAFDKWPPRTLFTTAARARARAAGRTLDQGASKHRCEAAPANGPWPAGPPHPHPAGVRRSRRRLWRRHLRGALNRRRARNDDALEDGLLLPDNGALVDNGVLLRQSPCSTGCCVSRAARRFPGTGASAFPAPSGRSTTPSDVRRLYPAPAFVVPAVGDGICSRRRCK